VLFKDGALPEISFQESFSNVSQALSNKAAAQERLDDYRIKAPHDGVIGYIKWLGHDTILAGEEVLHLSSPTSNRLRASLSARSHAELKSGQKLTIDLPHGGALSATIDKIAPDLSAPQQRFFIEAALEEPLALPPGTEVAISLELPPNNTVLIVPADALDVNPLGPVVWVITETNEHFYAHPYPCQIISYSGTEVAITHPKLQAGEKVVILGGFKLIAGQEVIPYV
jgi:RND family efflux transporter MFP subunit